MLPKKIRLTTALFDQVFKTGKVQHSLSFWSRFILLPVESTSRFAVAVPKKIAQTAVLRNKIKKIVYKAIETFGADVLASQPSVMVIFGVKKDISKFSFKEIAEELQGLYLKKGQK